MNIGLVLSGGMAKGAYQVGALKAINEFIPHNEITHISASSVGVLNGYAYAANKLETVEEMWTSLCTKNSRLIITTVLRSELLQKRIIDIYDDTDELPETFYCTLLDFTNKNVIYKDLAKIDKSQIRTHLKASVCMPIFNRAVKIDGNSCYDGATVDNIPVYPLIPHENLDYIICLYFDDVCYKFENNHFDDKIIKISFPNKSLLLQSVIFEESDIRKMIDDGYARTKEVLSTIFANGYQDTDAVLKANRERIKNSEKPSLRITGDVLITNLNKVTRKIAKREAKT